MGGQGRQLTAEQRAEREAKILKLWDGGKGLDMKRIAERLGMSYGRVGRIVREHAGAEANLRPKVRGWTE